MLSYKEDLTKYKSQYNLLAYHIPQIIAVKNDLKTATLITISNNQDYRLHFPALKNFCEPMGLVVQTYHYHVPVFNRTEIKILISKKKLSIPQEHENQNIDNRFSYPNCCIANYGRWTKFEDVNHDLLNSTNTCDMLMNPFFSRSPFSLFKHVPCSLNCSRTIQKAKETLLLLRDSHTNLHTSIINYLHDPVFFTDIAGTGISLCNYSKIDSMHRYEKAYLSDPSDLKKLTSSLSSHNQESDLILLSNILESFFQGDNFTLNDTSLIIRKQNSIITTFLKPPILNWKIINFI